MEKKVNIADDDMSATNMPNLKIHFLSGPGHKDQCILITNNEMAMSVMLDFKVSPVVSTVIMKSDVRGGKRVSPGKHLNHFKVFIKWFSVCVRVPGWHSDTSAVICIPKVAIT